MIYFNEFNTFYNNNNTIIEARRGSKDFKIIKEMK